jgi:hypothetical protein
MAKGSSGAVLPPGTLKPNARLPAGTYAITIQSADPVGTNPDDGVYATCVYPDGWVKDHQVLPDDPAGLFEKIVGQLRGKYGAGEVQLVSLPSEVKAGTQVTVEV